MPGSSTVFINAFSLVAYLPEPLAGFVDTLRHELEPDAHSRGHVTLLPPRPIDGGLHCASEVIDSVLSVEFTFDIHLGKVEVFPATKVLHLSIGEGAAKLNRLHRALNRGACGHMEAYYYHPHVTLAQGIETERVNEACETATQRWSEYSGPRSFALERVTLVQNINGEWTNLQEFSLRTPVIVSH